MRKGMQILWPRGRGNRKRRPKTGRGREEAEEMDRVEIAPGVTVESLRRSRVALIEPSQNILEAESAASGGNPENLRVRCRCDAFGCTCEVLIISINSNIIVAIRGEGIGWLSSRLAIYQNLPSECPYRC